jgi:hypothetical protein
MQCAEQQSGGNMDLVKLRVRQDLERMIINYRIRGDISEDQCDRLCHFIDTTIGGGEFLKPSVRKGPSVIPFPAKFTGAGPQLSEEEKREQEARRRALSEIYAPYGEPLPEGVKDFRKLLQRDGLILICWEKLTSKEGTFYNVLWAQSRLDRRCTEWSGIVREERIPYAMPLDDDHRSYYYSDDKMTLAYTVTVAPDNILDGPLSDFSAYVKTIKSAGIKNSAGNKVNFDYIFNFTAEKKGRFMATNKQLIEIRLPARIITVLNDLEIYRLDQLKKTSIQRITIYETNRRGNA